MITGWILLAASTLGFLMLGIVLGLLLAERAHRRALMSVGHFAARMLYKALLRTFNARNVRRLEQVDMEHSALSMCEKMKRADPSAVEAARMLKDRLSEIFGDELSAVYFFGSRMRGSYTPWSDLDVVMFFRSTVSLTHARTQVRREVFRILLQHGLLIQPRLANDRALYAVDAELHPMIRRAVQTGIPIV